MADKVLVEHESWLKRNAIPIITAIISLGVILATLSATYGRILTSLAAYESELASYRTELAKVEAGIAEVNVKVDTHHTDTERHLDRRQWELIQQRFDSIEQLIRQHMRTPSTRPVN